MKPFENYDLFTAKDYLKSQDFDCKYYDYYNGLLTEILFYSGKFDKQVSVHISLQEDYEKEILKSEKETVELDLSRFNVDLVNFQSHITTEKNFLTGSIERIRLVNNPEEGDYYTHPLSLFKYVLSLYEDNGVSHEYYILQKHLEHLDWINSVLHKTLKRADYVYEGSDIFSIKEGSRTDSNLCVYFRHPNTTYDFWAGTDCLTGEFICGPALSIYKKSEEELWDYLIKEYWKKDTEFQEGPYTYLYTEGQDINTWKECINA